MNAAPHAFELGLSAVIGLIAGALSVGVAIAAFPVFRQYSQALALWFLALAVVVLALTGVEQATVLSLLSVSEAYTQADAGARAAVETLAVVVRAARNWAHYINLIVAGAEILVLYGVLYRYALVPRLLAGFGLVAVVLQLTTVTRPLFGQDVVLLMLMPLALSHLALALWLITKGLAAPEPGAADARPMGE